MRGLTFDMADNTLTVFIEQDIDHHAAKAIRDRIDEQIALCKPAIIILNFDAVGFMDSSGVGLIMGRYRRANDMGAQLYLCALNGRLRRILELSGVLELVEVLEEK